MRAGACVFQCMGWQVEWEEQPLNGSGLLVSAWRALTAGPITELRALVELTPRGRRHET